MNNQAPYSSQGHHIHDGMAVPVLGLWKRLFPFMLATFLLLYLLYPRVAKAGGSFEWTGEGESSSWTDSCNWHPKDSCQDTYPGQENDDDEATLGLEPGPYHIQLPTSITLKSLTILGATNLHGGELTVTDTFQWHGGRISTKITVAPGATMDIINEDLLYLSDATRTGEIVLYGSGLWTGGGQINLLGDTIFTNHGTFTVEGAATLFGHSCCRPPTANFNNFGTLIVDTPLVPLVPTQMMVDNISFIHQGVVQVQEGAQLTLGGGNHELAAGSRFTGQGRTIIAQLAGDPRINGAVTIDPGATVELSSHSLQGEGTFEGGGTFNWTGGEVRSKLTIADDTTLLFSGPNEKRLVRQPDNDTFRGELSALGNVRWEDTSQMMFRGPAIFNNHSVFDIQGNATFQAGSCCVPPTSVFNNFGALKIQGVASAFNGVFVNNAGEIQVVEGTLSAAGGARYTQTAGTTRIDNGAVQTVHELRIEGGRLEGTGVITGNVYSSGEVHPGLSTGILRIVGQYTQAPEGLLAIGIAGDTVGTRFDQLQVGGQATVDGTLDVAIGDGFDPACGEHFPILLFDSRSGEFAQRLGFELDNGRPLTAIYNPGDLTLTVGQQAGNPICITAITLAHQSVSSGEWQTIGEDGTTDGNRVRVSATLVNDGEPVAATVRLIEATHNRPLAPAIAVDLAAGTREIELELDSSGSAWVDGHAPAPVLTIALALDTPTNTVSQTIPLPISPKPVVLVHGMWSDADAWSGYGPLLAARHPQWRGYAVGDGQFPGVMNTGSMLAPLSPPNTIYENAEILAGYIQALRAARNAWQVDMVGHSMGGLIARQYIQSLMPDLPDGKPVVYRLVMLGTPNLGSRCAIDFPFMATYELRPDVVADFNRLVRHQRGVPFSILAGNPLPLTCSSPAAGDMVVAVTSAFGLPYVSDTGLSGSLHTALNTSADDFANFVLPRLALAPSAVQQNSVQAEIADARDTDDEQIGNDDDTSPPQLILLETVAVDQTRVVGIPVPTGDRFGVTVLASPTVGLFLENPAGTVVESITADDPRAQEPIRALSVADAPAGEWRLRLENTDSGAASVTISGWIQGDPLFLTLNVGPVSAEGDVHLTATFVENGTPVTGAQMIARVTGMNSVEQELALRDDGASGDGAANDGVYSGTLTRLEPSQYLVVVRATTDGELRATTAAFSVNAGGGYDLFVPSLQR